MTATTKVEGRTYADLSVWGKRFDKRAMKELAGYLSSMNLGVTQTLAQTDADPDTTGTKPILINGVYIPSLAAGTDTVWANGNTAGLVMENTYGVWLMYKVTAAGVIIVDLASNYALDADTVLKIPKWDASLYAPVAVAFVNAAGAVTIGTTNIAAITTETQLLGAVLPHPDNFAN